jgi:two-component system, OmpR family, alkaline phosphatase synthesis response regulator PhoP
MASEVILLIEDDFDIRELVSYGLEKERYRVYTASSAEDARRWLGKRLPDLILLDLMLPGMDGFSFCKEIKKDDRTARVPVVMLTARTEDADVVAGLEVGAEDFIPKPFSMSVLAARVRAIFRRREPQAEEKAAVLTRGPFEIDTAHHSVKVSGQPVTLTIGEFKVLELFVRKPGIVFSRYQIVDAIHGKDHAATDRAVDVLIVGLRKKLGEAAEWIETVRGVGYRMKNS